MAKIIVQVYDPKVLTAPFKLITLFEFEIEFSNNRYETKLAMVIEEIQKRGYAFRFWSYDDDGIYYVTVHNYGSPGSVWYYTDHLNTEYKTKTHEDVDKGENQ